MTEYWEITTITTNLHVCATPRNLHADYYDVCIAYLIFYAPFSSGV